MTQKFVDLHLHSSRSDGSDAPARVVERAAEHGLAAIAITDHDTLSGLAEGATEAAARGIEFLPGTEVSAECDGIELHILGLGVRPDAAEICDGLQTLVERRKQRAVEIVARLNQLGVPVDQAAIEARTAGGIVGRMHIAQEIVESGHAKTVQHAFDKYIKKGRPAFVSKQAMPCEEAVDRIHAAGGLAFVAHPGLGDQYKRFSRLLLYPFDGIEVYHSRHSADRVKALEDFANGRGLLMSGGSDCHGTVKGEKPLMGCANVRYEIYDRIRDALEAR